VSDKEIRTWEAEEFKHHIDLPWQQYLDRLEKGLLKRGLKPTSWFVDLGGGDGRLYEVYKDVSQHKVIVDYSLDMLLAAQKKITDLRNQNTYLIAADITNLPFQSNVFDGGLMLRVIHHIQEPSSALEEANRILKPGSSLFFEYQNKKNINSILKAVMGFTSFKNILDQSPLEVKPLFWNYSPGYIEGLVRQYFYIDQVYGGGIFWNRKLITTRVKKLEDFDLMLAPLLGIIKLTHQLFMELRVKKEVKEDKTFGKTPGNNILSILQCNRCKIGSLEYVKGSLKCEQCGRMFLLSNNIIDFR